MKRFLFSIFFLFAAIQNPYVTAAQGSEEEIQQLLDERDQEIKELLGPKGSEYTDEQREQLKEIINGIIDFEAMAREALAETYDTISEEQRNEFVELFSIVIRDQSLNRLDIYRADVTYNEITTNGDTARVETTAQLENVRTPVNYDMVYDGEQWFITDMEIDDVSTVNSYNRQFQRIIAQRGFDVLMDSLRKRAAR